MRRIALLRAVGFALLGATLLAGCARRAPVVPGTTLRWLSGHSASAFDPDGPADPQRRALEGALSYGLYARDSAGAVRPLAAETAEWSDDRRTLTLRLRPGLRFTDGSPAGSADFREALLAGLARDDHATARWLLEPLTGLERVRAGRPLPPIGIEAPEPRTLVLHLSRPDSTLLERLACPGLGVPWRRRAGVAWAEAVGLGPYRVLDETPGRALTLVRADSSAVPRAAFDTVQVRFVLGAPRVRFFLRHLSTDLVWPLPPALMTQALPPGWQIGEHVTRPPRRLLLVFRSDVPPTTELPARAALAHALNRSELLAALGQSSAGTAPWLEGAGEFDFPRLDADETRSWLERGHLGASFHVELAYDADGAAAEIARALQGEWAELGLYAELRPLRGAAALTEPLGAAAAQVQIVEVQAPLPGAPAELAGLVMPLRGPAVGTVRTGWRTREFDPWISAPDGAAGFDAAGAQARLADEVIALPLAVLPWRWLHREGAADVRFDPWVGPIFSHVRPPAIAAVTAAAGSR